MNEYIQLKKRNVLRIGIKDENDVAKVDENGNEVYIEFDLEDIEIPERYSKCVYLINKATDTLNSDFIIINKKQDSKGRGIMTKNQEAKMQALKRFYKSMEEAIDYFLGKGGTQKIFGNARYLTMFDDLSEMLEPIMPKLQVNVDNIDKKIKEKYKTTKGNVLKDE